MAKGNGNSRSSGGDKIAAVFEKMKEMGITFSANGKKQRLSDRTLQTYANVVRAYENYLKQEHGLKDITRAKPRHAYEYVQKQIEQYKKTGEGSPWSMRRFAHAIHAFQEASARTGVYQHKIKLGDKRVILDMLNQNQILRKSELSNTLKATHTDYEKVQKEILSSRSPNAKIASEIHQIQRFLGARITEAIRLRKSDLTFNLDGSVTARIKGKGGLTRYVTTYDKSTVELLKKRVEGKKDDAPIFQVKNRQGNDKSVQNAAKQIKDLVRSAAIRAGVDRDGKKYTTHSARKAFAQARMDYYAKMSKQQLQKELEKRIKENQERRAAGSPEPDIQRKKEQVLRNIRNKMTNKARAAKRELTHKELCGFLVSIDLGHFRLDVIRYYCTYPSKDRLYNKIYK